jgi:drug/metabolite transporter (DMT)-like permease
MPLRSPSVALVLAVATVAVSTAAPLIRLSEMPALALAAWRTLLCGAVYALFRPRQLAALATLDGRGRRALLLGSTLMAAHFALWISAFEHTSYAAAVLLLVMQPVFGALLGLLVLGERPDAGTWLAVAGSAAGLALLVHEDLGRPGGLFGDGLAVAGCLAIAVFYLVVRPLRTGFPFAPFMAACYGLAGLQLVVLSLAMGSPLTGFAARGWWCVAGLVLIPTVVGHACFNWAIPRVRFFTLNLLIVLEPALALLLGVVLLDEGASAWQLAGGVVLGLAVLAGLRRRPGDPEPTPSPA